MTMGISDILTLIGLLFAIFAFIYEAEGEFIFIKFNWSDVLTVFLAFLFLNYLLFHTFYFEQGWYWNKLYHEWGLHPPTWSYLVSLAIIAYLFFRIFFGVIPYSNRSRLISFYKRLLNKADFTKVMGYIEKYHEKRIFKYHAVFQKNQRLEEKEYNEADHFTQFRLMRGDIYYKNQIKYSNQETLAGVVYRWIIERDDFINATANEFPYFYANIFKHFDYKYSPNEEVVYWFFSSLLAHNNQFLKRELKSNVNLQEGERHNYRIEDDNEILKSILLNIKVAENTYVWKPFGESSIQELNALDYDHFLFEPYDSNFFTDSKFFDLTIGKSIRFFDIMVCRAIYKKHGFHMWLPYYYHFANIILERADENGFYGEVENWKTDYPLNFLFLVYRMTSNIFEWYQAMADALYAGHTITISKTMSGILFEIANSNSIGEPWKIGRFDLFIKIYCEISTAPVKEGHQEQSENVKNAIKKSIEDAMIRPGYGSNAEKIEQYHTILKLAWQDFDRVPYEQTTALGQLQANVFNKI